MLVGQRPFKTQPPIIEWFRVADAFSKHRFASFIDENDVLQTARLLLPGIDYPQRNQYEELTMTLDHSDIDSNLISCYLQNLNIEMGFKLLFSGQSDLMKQGLNYLPLPTKINTYNQYGLTALMVAVIKNELFTLRSLIGKSSLLYKVTDIIIMKMRNFF